MSWPGARCSCTAAAGGNDNRFDSLLDCHGACLAGSRKNATVKSERCALGPLKVEEGNSRECRGMFPKYTFNLRTLKVGDNNKCFDINFPKVIYCCFDKATELKYPFTLSY